MTTDEEQTARLRDPIYKCATRLKLISVTASSEQLSDEERARILGELLIEARFQARRLQDSQNLTEPNRGAYKAAYSMAADCLNHLGAVLDAGATSSEHDRFFDDALTHARELAEVAQRVV